MDTAIRVLLVEDEVDLSEVIAESIRRVSSGQIQPIRESRLSEALSRLSESRFDAIVTDLGLPDCYGLEAFRRLHAFAPDTPVVILSGDNDDEHAIQAVREGAQDFFVKGDVDYRLIARSLMHAIERNRLEVLQKRSVRREAAVRRLLRRIMELQHIADFYSVLGTHWMEELRGIDLPATETWLHFPSSRATHCVTSSILTLGRPESIEEHLLDHFPWTKKVWERGEGLVASREQFAQLNLPPGVERIVEVPLFESGSLSVWCETTEVSDEEALQTISLFAGLIDDGLRHIQDMEILHQTEDAIRRSEQRYQRLFEESPAMHIITRDSGVGVPLVAACNRAFRSALGYGTDEVIGQPVGSFYTAESRALMEGGGYRRGLDGAFTAEERQLVTRDGRVLDTIITVRQEFEADEVVGTQATYVDVTQQKMQEKRLAQVIEQNRVMVWEVDREGLYTYVTPTIETLLGYRPHEVIGKLHFYDLAPEPEREELKRTAFEVIAAKVAFADFVSRIESRDGRTVWLSTNGTPVINAGGDILGYQGLNLDVTERIRGEEKRVELERQLLQARKFASMATMAIGLGNRFNNDLQVIMGHLELAQQELSGEAPAQSELKGAILAAERAGDLMDQLLSYAGRSEFAFEKLRLNDFLAANETMFTSVVPQSISMEMRCSPGLPPVSADTGQILQALMNLLSNAAESIGERRGAITVSAGVADCDEAYLSRSLTEEKPAPGCFVAIDVTDTGNGIDAETIQSLSDPFFTTKPAALGMGLSAVLGIVSGHGGGLLIESEVGRGTTVRMLLPALDEIEVDNGPAVAVAASVPVPPAPPVSGAVLVVDDSPSIRATFARMVTMLGYQALTAQDGEHAVKTLSDNREAVVAVLLDFIMPRTDIVATLQELRRIKPGVQVIMCSGLTEEYATRRLAGHGLAGFLQKPARVSALKEALDRVLGETGSQQEEQRPCP